MRMFELGIAGPLITLFVVIDISIHYYYDYRKIKKHGVLGSDESTSTFDSSFAIAAIVISTFSNIAVILGIVITYISNNLTFLNIVVILPLFDPPEMLWITGLAIVLFGLAFHSWSRYTRGEMAFSWSIDADQKLVTTGPYAIVRHPSYSSYILLFLGGFLLIPSVTTLLALIGIPGYYSVAKTEEILLVKHFGDEYRAYQMRTGMLFPKFFRK